MTVTSKEDESFRINTKTDAAGRYVVRFEAPIRTVLVAFAADKYRSATRDVEIASEVSISINAVMGDPESPLAQWLIARHIQVRRTFDGSRYESKPAEVAWANTSPGREYWNINAGVKLGETWFAENRIVVYPVVEWHHFATGEELTRKFTAKLTAEFQPKFREITPTLFLSWQYDRDLEKDKWSEVLTALAGAFGTGRYFPGASNRFADNRLMFRYFPYAGIERHGKKAFLDKAAVLGVARIATELFWVSARDPEFQIAQLGVGYTYRRNLRDSANLEKTTRLFTATALVFLDRRAHFGIGYTYQRGEDPANDFKSGEQSSVGLQVIF